MITMLMRFCEGRRKEGKVDIWVSEFTVCPSDIRTSAPLEMISIVFTFPFSDHIIISYREDNRNGIARKGYGAIAKKGARKGVDIDGMDGWVDMENQDLDDKKKKKTDDDDEEEEEED